MNANPGITIVVPSFQQGAFIESAIQSLLAQRYSPLEILVMDGGSTDGTREILQRYEKKIYWRSRPDEGQTDAIHEGFFKSHGEILGWLNSDDLLLPGTLQRVSALFREDPGLDVVYGHCVFIDREGQFLRYFSEIRPFDEQVLTNEINFIAQPACFYRRRALESVGSVDTRLHYVMDWDLWCRMARCGLCFRFVPEVLAAARMYPETKTSRGGWSRLQEILTTNRRYGTGKLPRAFLNHFYSEHLLGRAFIPTINRWRKKFLGLTRQAKTEEPVHPATILGCLPHSRDAFLPCRLIFPWYRPLRQVHLVIQSVSSPATGRQRTVRLNGAPVPLISGSPTGGAEEMVFHRDFSEHPFTEAVAIDIEETATDSAPSSRIRLRQWVVR
jgi:glycosyltransferase involved in cell wall biosynthesis